MNSSEKSLSDDFRFSLFFKSNCSSPGVIVTVTMATLNSSLPPSGSHEANYVHRIAVGSIVKKIWRGFFYPPKKKKIKKKKQSKKGKKKNLKKFKHKKIFIYLKKFII